jgi:hypothetical protein
VAADAASLPEALMTILLNQLYFLEHSPTSDLDPRAAERMTQEIAYQLARVPPDELAPLIEFIQAQAEASAWEAEREFLRALPRHLGWR